MQTQTAIEAVEFVETAGQALAAAEKLATAVSQDAKKISAMVPQHVDMLKTAGLITEQEKQAATDQLSTHEGALITVANLCAILSEKSAEYERKLAMAGGGRSVDHDSAPRKKQADAGSNYSDGGYVGRRRGLGERSEADMALIRGLKLEDRIGG